MSDIKTVYCAISNVPLLSVSTLCLGTWPLVVKFDGALAHPVYDLPHETLLRKLTNQLAECDRNCFQLSDAALLQLQLTTSATLRAMNCLVSNAKRPSGLPPKEIVIGCAGPLLSIAQRHLTASKRPALPKYRPDRDWSSFKGWTEAATQIYEDFYRAAVAPEDVLEHAISEAGESDMRAVYNKLDTKKVWAWIEAQCTDVPMGRLITFKELFTTTDLNPIEWLQDDVDDLTEVISKHCDGTHDVMHFVMSRCNSIRRQLREYNSGFSLLTASSAESKLLDTPEQLGIEAEAISVTMTGYRAQAASLTAAPVPPSRKDFPKLVDFLKTQAEFNLISKLYKEAAAAQQGI